MKEEVLKVIGLITPGRFQKIQCRDYPPNKHFLIKPPQVKVQEAEGKLEDKFFVTRTDNNGFITSAYQAPENSKEVIFMGGSTTECIWNEEDYRWPTRVASAFNQLPNKTSNIATFNSGVWGNTTAQSVNLLINKVLPLQPDIAVLMHNINDLVLMIHERDYWQATIPSRKILVRSEWDAMPTTQMRQVYLSRKLNKLKKRFKTMFSSNSTKEDEFAATRKAPSELDENTFQKQFEDNLKTFIFLCQLKGVKPVLMTQASRLKAEPDESIRGHVETMMMDKGLTYEKVREYFDALNNSTRKIAAESGTLLIDLDKHIPQTADMMFDSVHFTDMGCDAVAAVIAKQLSEKCFAEASQDKG